MSEMKQVGIGYHNKKLSDLYMQQNILKLQS